MYRLQNGWTKEAMIQKIKEMVPENGCRNAETFCVYRNEYGKACAVGAFLDDKTASILLEYNHSCHSLESKYPDIKWDEIFPLEMEGMCVMQEVHDFRDQENKVVEKLINWINENVE